MSSNRKHRAAAAEVFAQQNVANLRDAPASEAQQQDSYYAGEDDFDEMPEFQLAKPAAPPAPIIMGGNAPIPQQAQDYQRKMTPKDDLPALYAFKTSEELQLEKEPIQVRETGFLFWKRVIVPPNAYVVHTRAGRNEPVTLGLGLSFRYNPQTDAYLVVPAAMQTIGVVSNCISKEKQGINVLAYVQWQISDFAVAYRKLDFSDAADPLGIVNAQMREQADAAIKDKIATMSVEEVLTDKAPVIEELTRRLIEVAEGRVRGSESAESGLGIKIVTVQIKEALVSSRNLWENLQAPYRHEQERVAKISFLDLQEDIRTKQLATRQITETSEAETQVQIERVREEKQTEALQLRLAEDEKRKQREQESRTAQIQREQELRLSQARLQAEAQAQLDTLQREQQIQALEAERALVEQQAQIEQQRLAHEAALKRAQFEHEQLLAQHSNALKTVALDNDMALKLRENQAYADREAVLQQVRHRQAQLTAEIERLQQETHNLVSQEALLKEWITVLPQLAESMPDVQEMRVLQMGDGDNHLATFLAQQGSIFSTLRQFLGNGKAETE
jgi:regulator of protease activity HflC (stomatin/prohibitin superfamily)